MKEKKLILCSLCGKSQREVRSLLQGSAGGVLCNECWEEAAEIFGEMLGVTPENTWFKLRSLRLEQVEKARRRKSEE